LNRHKYSVLRACRQMEPGDVLARCVASRRQPSPVVVFHSDLHRYLSPGESITKS
ncbi:hypothetical protein A2U01_0058063, partial [Trifolium medium]|nr:hypothetical protein [Trifolium medium]